VIDVPPWLVVIGGLPATGKSTIATLVARQLRAPYLRVDQIEHAIVAWSSLDHPVGVVGYSVAYGLALDQLVLGLDVVVECVNPLAVTRDAWLSTAEGAGAAIVEVELVCTDSLEHRRRVQTRGSDVEGLVKPTWAQVTGHEYDPWNRPHLRIDTARVSAPEAAARIVNATRVGR
jgi:predicted kinase